MKRICIIIVLFASSLLLRSQQREINFNVKLARNSHVLDRPVSDGKVLFRLKKGTIVNVQGMEDSYFYLITYDGKDGWLHDTFFLKDKNYADMLEEFELLKEEEQRKAAIDRQPESILNMLEADESKKKEVDSIGVIVSILQSKDVLEKYNSVIVDTSILGIQKKTFYIQIHEPLTKEQLEEVAIYLKNNNSQYDRLFIFYLLPDMNKDAGAWATTHYNKDLEVKIFGVDKSAQEKMTKVIVPSEEIIGKWYDNTPSIEHSLIIFKVGDRYRLKRTFKDGSSDEKELRLSTYKGKSRFDYKNESREYLLIEKDGRLSYYDAYGLIKTCKKINQQ